MSCGSNKVITDFDETMDFGSYKTYGFYENVGKELNDLDIKRILKVIDTTLQQKGLTFSETPDFFIDFNAKKNSEVARNSVAVGFGNAGPNSVFGVSSGIPLGSKKFVERLFIEFLTPKNEQLIWQGFFDSTVKEKRTPQEKEVYFKEVIPKILSYYPPK